MPLLAINLSDTLFDQIKPLVDKSLYKSLEAFLEIAAFNQLAMERGVAPAEIVERGHRKIKEKEHDAKAAVSAHHPKRPAEPPAKPRVETVRSVIEPVARVTTVVEVPVTEVDYEETFKHLALLNVKEGPKPISTATDNESQGRVFGQVNRLLPLKLACRWLANAATRDGHWPRYELISDKLADDAGTIGSLLEQWDAENDRKRDKLLSTGLPRRGNSASRDRFLSQFVARVTRSGEIFPATICQYQLARFDSSAIALTEQGLAFSQLPNPILDKRDKQAAATLSSEETAFLADHILELVDTERDDMRVILKAIDSGSKTPSELTETIRNRFPPEWSDSVFQTHTSGLVSRLGELRLVKRAWQGRNVNYELGDQKQIDAFLKD